MKEIYNAEDIDKAQLAIKAFEVDYGAKYPKAIAKIVDDADMLLEFYRYPPSIGYTFAPLIRSKVLLPQYV
jgi:transposase-like protein